MAELRLDKLDAGPVTCREGRALADWVKTCAHLCDHLLTAPERDEWAALVPAVDVLRQNDRGLLRYARRVWREQGAPAQELYEDWLRVVRGAVAKGDRLGWTWTERRADGGRGKDVVVFSPEGVKVVATDRVVRTAHIPLPASCRIHGVAPGDARPASREDEIARRKKNPLPRQGRWVGKPRPRRADPRRAGFVRFRRAACEVRSTFFLALKRTGGTQMGRKHSFRAAIRDFDSWAKASGDAQPETTR